MPTLLDYLLENSGQGVLPAQPAPQSNPLGERQPLTAGITGFFNARSPMGAIGGLIGGLTTGQRTDDPYLMQQEQQAAYNLAQQQGLSQQQAVALAQNPAALKAIAPQFHQIGADIYGQPQYGFINSLTQKVTPLQGQQGTANPYSGVDENKPLFGQLPKKEQSLIDDMLAGKAPIPSSFALSKPIWVMRMAAASERAREQGQEGFDATTWGQRVKTRNDFATNGVAGKSLSALDTVQGHLAKGSDAVEKLKGTNWNFINGLYNYAASNTPIDPAQRDALNEWNNARTAIEDEMAKAYKGGQMSDTEIARWNQLLGNAKSPNDLRRALKDFTELLNTKREQLYTTHNTIMGFQHKTGLEEQNQRVTGLIRDRFNAAMNPPSSPPSMGAPGSSTGGWTVRVK